MIKLYYGKLRNNDIIFAPEKLHINNKWIYNANQEQYFSLGYKTIKYTDEPQINDNQYLTFMWEEFDTEIVQKWTINNIEIFE